jgi:hypothetical protein
MNNLDLIARLRAELSWAVARKADNPAVQAMLEMRKAEDPTFVNPLVTDQNIRELLFDLRSVR